MSDFTYNSFPIPAKPLSGVGETSYLSALLGIAPGGVKKVPTASFLAAAGVYPVALLQCTPQITQVIGDVAANTTLIPLIADTTVSGGNTGVSTGGMSVGDTSPNSGKIVISEAGLYRVSCSIRITRTSSDGGECGAVIKKNGSSVITSVYDEADTDDHFTLTCPTVIASLASGDVLSLNAAIVGGSSDSIYVNGASLLPEDVPTPTSVVLVERLNSASGDSSSTESLAELAAEVQDAREGYDGTTYASLGAAIRSQVAMAMASGISDDVKTALLDCFAHVAWIDDDGQDYYDALEAALSARTLVSISAAFDQTGVTIYDTDTLDDLKQYLTVTAHYDDATTATVQGYTLSGTLTPGTSIITVSYGGQTDTFNVTVTHKVVGWYYPFNQSLDAESTNDFGWTGAQNYVIGHNGVDYAYYHKVTTEGDATTDVGAIQATGLANPPALGTGDFTIAFWFAGVTEMKGHPLAMSQWATDTAISAANKFFTSATQVGESGWGFAQTGTASGKYAGITIWWISSSGVMDMAFHNSNSTKSAQLQFTPPSGFSSTDWHHYAITRSGSNFYFFIDGVLVGTAVSELSIYNATQIAIGSLFYQTSAQKTQLQNMGNGDKVSNFYLVKRCKWTSNFDPNQIVYD